ARPWGRFNAHPGCTLRPSKTMQTLKRRKRRAPTGRLCVGAFFISEFGINPAEPKRFEPRHLVSYNETCFSTGCQGSILPRKAASASYFPLATELPAFLTCNNTGSEVGLPACLACAWTRRSVSGTHFAALRNIWRSFCPF